MWVHGFGEISISDPDLPQAKPKPLGVSEEKDSEMPTEQGLIPS